ncbi:MAG: hypothetical protein J6A69_12685 [Clostridia bacterium]|nr:hypothetical protein [Clostridia bacterium]
MTVTDFVIIGVVVLIVGGAITYIVKEKKSGAKCIGCPYSKSCSLHSKNTNKESCSYSCKNDK